MVATRLIKTFLTLSLVLISSFRNSMAEMMQKGRTKVKTVFNFYHQNSDDGDQVIDNSGREEANVFEPMVFIEHQISEDTSINGRFVFDGWSAASDTKLDDNTGASGDKAINGQSRTSGSLGVRKEVDNYSYSGEIGFSSEYDYQSINGTLNVTGSFAKDNFTIGLTAQYFKDELSLFTDISNPDDSIIKDGFSRDIIATTIAASQILTPKDIIQFDLTYVNASGYMESTSGTVLVNGVRKLELLPESRNRYALSTKWVHGVNDETALNLSYRFYTDDWGLSAHTSRAAYLVEVNDDEDFVEYSIRVHSQSSIDYFKTSFSDVQENMTSDSDLDEFQSYEAGFFYNANLMDKEVLGLSLEDFVLSNGIVYGQRTNGLRFGYFQTSLKLEF